MLNFRKELNKVAEGVNNNWSTEEYAEFVLIGLLAAMRHAFPMKTFCCEHLVFILVSDKICVKFSENHVSDLFVLTVNNSKQIFECILKKFKEENFTISNISNEKFKVYLV